MRRLLSGFRIGSGRAERLSDLAAMSASVGAAARFLHPASAKSANASLTLVELGHEIAGSRRRLQTRLTRAGFHTIDPRLLCDAATEMVEVVRLIARAVRCREWLLLSDPDEAQELQSLAGLGAQLVAESALELASTGAVAGPSEAGDSLKTRAVLLYDQGIGRAFGECVDPLDVLRQRTLYDALLAVVIGSGSALAALRDASAD